MFHPLLPSLSLKMRLRLLIANWNVVVCWKKKRINFSSLHMFNKQFNCPVAGIFSPYWIAQRNNGIYSCISSPSLFFFSFFQKCKQIWMVEKKQRLREHLSRIRRQDSQYHAYNLHKCLRHLQNSNTKFVQLEYYCDGIDNSVVLYYICCNFTKVIGQTLIWFAIWVAKQKRWNDSKMRRYAKTLVK